MRKYRMETLYEADDRDLTGFRIAGFAVTSGQGEEVCRSSTPDEVMLKLEAPGIPREEVLRPDPERRAR